MPEPAMITARALKKSFGGKSVLDGVDLDVREGETHVVLGRSGEGKSVLLKHVCALLAPDAGEVFVDGVKVEPGRRSSLRHVRSRVQMLFQGAALFDSMTVAQNVAFHAIEHSGISAEDAEAAARPFLEMVNLPEAGPLNPSELSGGMRKRAGLARALAAKPRIMLYDEPTTGLDPMTAQTINELIRDTQKNLGVTSIVVTHDIQSARFVADRCSFLLDGRIAATGSMDEMAALDHPLIGEFFRTAGVGK